MRLIRETIAAVACAFGIGVVWQSWQRLPAQIPTHFAGNGRPDGYGPPSTLWLVPAIALFLYSMLTIFSFFPQSFNYPVKVTDENRVHVQRIAVAMLGWLKAELMGTLAYITWATVRTAKGEANGLGLAFLPILLAMVGLTLTAGIVMTRRAG